MKLLENAGVLDLKKTEYVRTDIHSHETRNHKPKYIVIDADISYDFSEIRTFIKSQMPETKIIYVTTELIGIPEDDTDILTFEIPFISFREFAEGHHHPVNIGDVMQGNAPAEELIELRDQYIHLGAFGENLTKGENT